MKGLYLNVTTARESAERIDTRLGSRSSFLTATHARFPELLINNHPEDWPDGPSFSDPQHGLFAAASGWFVFRGRWGALAELTRSFAERVRSGRAAEGLAGIDAGAFVILFAVDGEPYIVTDPFGLHPHYFADDPFSRLAPSPHFLRDGRDPDPQLASILRRQNHVFGNLTAYRGIERLEPGAVITPERTERYFDYVSPPCDVQQLPATLADSLGMLEGRRRILPLSGGLDSRLLALSSRCDFGYTFGPPDSGDRPVARLFADRFAEYRELSLLQLQYPGRFREAGAAIFDGICDRPFLEIISVYHHLHAAWGDGPLFVDGYLGDVLQRATYLTYGGVRGSLAKLLPWMTVSGLDALALLRRRYAALDPAGHELLARVFAEKMASLDLDEAHKALLFEILYGRGARYSLNGGTLLSGQYWSPVQAFFIPRVFRVLFGQDLADALFYRTVQRIWSAIPARYAEAPTYSGFKPIWNPHRSRATMLLVKGLAKAGIARRARSYEHELRQVVWQK